MQIYPAIDLSGGQCIRLTQGDFNQATIYESNPLLQAKKFIDQGATWLHMVDLDGAKDPAQHQLPLIEQIIEQTPLTIQTGGGIRSLEDVTIRLQAGVERVIIGSLAVQQPEVVEQILNVHGAAHIVLALDVFIEDEVPMVATHGWQQTSEKDLHQVIARFIDLGLKHVLCTDIHCDGTLMGPNFALYRSITERYPELAVQASGGVSQLEDLSQLREIGVNGVIIGKALYENRFTLSEALAC